MGIKQAGRSLCSTLAFLSDSEGKHELSRLGGGIDMALYLQRKGLTPAGKRGWGSEEEEEAISDLSCMT